MDNQAIKLETPVNGSIVEDHWPDPPSDRASFYEDLQDFHRQRGTTLEPNPRVHGKPIDLFELFHNVVAKGGYDKVSAEKLLWRKVAAEFNLSQQHVAASAFGAKTLWYKNLAAYAIKRVHKQEPPPKEILEDITAKGGDLLSRTVDNFRPPQRFEQAVNGNDTDGSEDDAARTPKSERLDADEPASGERRTRGLRQAPPQRVLFQPDVSSSRQSRQNQPATGAIPQPYTQYTPGLNMGSASGTSNSLFHSSKYDPRISSQPLTFRSLATPTSNPQDFQKKSEQLRELNLTSAGVPEKAKPQFMAPGTGFPGTNIYLKALNALRSGVDDEIGFALHHLVKISHERGDKFKFEAFVGLTESLIEQGLRVGSLFFDVDWKISWLGFAGDEIKRIEFLDGIDGTPDILDRVRQLTLLEVSDDMQPLYFRQRLQYCVEAGLVIRNMAMLEENARYLSEQWPLRDWLSIVLSLPSLSCVVELKHYALELAEQLTKFWVLEANDPLYILLLRQLGDGQDRGAILTALRAICRISMNLEEPNRLPNISVEVIASLMNWILLDDEELIESCLDFFYQYTAVSENVAMILDMASAGRIPLSAFVHSLGRLFLHNNGEIVTRRLIAEAQEAEPNDEIPEPPQDLLEQLINISEPERSSTWLRACFEEHSESYMTQIRLWQAYQARFQLFSNPSKPLLQAAEFIKNISATFTNTSAQVITTEQPPKFIIKGIRPRRAPKDPKGRTYMSCLWTSPKQKAAVGASDVCGNFFPTPEKLFDHIIRDHIGLARSTSTGKWEFPEKTRRPSKEAKVKYNCYWADCTHFAASKGTDSPYKVGMHVKTHFSGNNSAVSPPPQMQAAKRRKVSSPNGSSRADKPFDKYIGRDVPAVYQEFGWKHTAMDERGNATGMSFTAVLVLRNLARTVPRAVTGVHGQKMAKQWMEDIFLSSIGYYYDVLAVNRVLAPNIFDLLATIDRSMEA